MILKIRYILENTSELWGLEQRSGMERTPFSWNQSCTWKTHWRQGGQTEGLGTGDRRMMWIRWGEGWKGWESKRRVMYPIFTWALQSYRLNIICLLWTRSWPPPKFIHWSSNPNVMVIFGFSVFSRHHSHLGGLLKTNCWASFTLRVSDLVSFKVGPEICISNKVFRRCWWCWARALLWEPLSCNIVSACWVSHYPSPEILHQTPHLDSYFYSHSA